MIGRVLGWLAFGMSMAGFIMSASSAEVVQPERAVFGTVVAFSDETRGKYNCALVETDTGMYLPVWYPKEHQLVRGSKVAYNCIQVVDTPAVEFRTSQYITKNGTITLNPNAGGKQMSPSKYRTGIGDFGSTPERHRFKVQYLATSIAKTWFDD